MVEAPKRTGRPVLGWVQSVRGKLAERGPQLAPFRRARQQRADDSEAQPRPGVPGRLVRPSMGSSRRGSKNARVAGVARGVSDHLVRAGTEHRTVRTGARGQRPRQTEHRHQARLDCPTVLDAREQRDWAASPRRCRWHEARGRACVHQRVAGTAARPPRVRQRSRVRTGMPLAVDSEAISDALVAARAVPAAALPKSTSRTPT